MELLPAIDIRDGRCVRLLRGDFEKETRYDVQPVELARRYAGLGATWLHVVDLDGAAQGTPRNLDVVRAMSAEGLRIQFGGGVRSEDDLRRALEVAGRVVVGSLAVTAPGLVEQWLGEFGPERLTLALDVRLDEARVPFVATHGWKKGSELTLWAALDRFCAVGMRHVLCTDVDRDGALTGPNVALYRECVARWRDVAFQASGGIRGVEDLNELAGTGVAHAISGKALLEGRLSEEEIRSFLPNG